MFIFLKIMLTDTTTLKMRQFFEYYLFFDLNMNDNGTDIICCSDKGAHFHLVERLLAPTTTKHLTILLEVFTQKRIN